MKDIKHFMLPEHINSLYRKEASSSISLTREVANKINELVDAYNELSKSNLEKIHEQDGTIRKGILYMKDNLINTLNDMMEQLLESGFVDIRIKNHISNLIERVDNLVGSIKEGSTTMDAEIIDGRVGYDTTVYDNLGNAIRNQIQEIYDMAKEIIKASETSIQYIHVDKLVDKSYYNMSGRGSCYWK